MGNAGRKGSGNRDQARNCTEDVEAFLISKVEHSISHSYSCTPPREIIKKQLVFLFKIGLKAASSAKLNQWIGQRDSREKPNRMNVDHFLDQVG